MMQAADLAVRPEVSRAVARIMSGAHFVCLLLDNKEQRAIALEAVLDKVADPNTRVVWVGNPLRSPLTIERFLIQIVGPEIDLRIERSPAQLVKLVTQPIGDESRLLVVVQQPETMGAEAREALAGFPAHLAGSVLQVQFLFVSSPTFTLMTFNEPGAYSAKPRSTVAPPSNKRLYILLPLTLLLGIALGIGTALAPSGKLTRFLEQFSSAAAAPPAEPPQVPEASQVSQVSQLPQAPQPPQVVQVPSTPPPLDLVALRREFDDFLAKRAPTTPPMTVSQKDALFREFLALHRRE